MDTSEHQSQTMGVGTPKKEWASDEALNLLKGDVAKLVLALESLVTEMGAIKGQLDRIEKTLRDVALGLGVRPE